MRSIKDINIKKITSVEKLKVGNWYILYYDTGEEPEKRLLFKYKNSVSIYVYDSGCFIYSSEIYENDSNCSTFIFSRNKFCVKASNSEVMKHFPN
jgi:hypothetical protein